MFDTRKDTLKNTSRHVFLFKKKYRATTSEWQGEPYFRIYGRELVSNQRFLKNIIEAPPVERLVVKLAVTTDRFCRHPRLLGNPKKLLARNVFLPSDNVEIMFQRQSVVSFPRTRENTISGHVRWKSAAQDIY